MQANVSLILNILLLAGVVYAMARIIRLRRQSLAERPIQPSMDMTKESAICDDIIAIRKITTEDGAEKPVSIQRKSSTVIHVASPASPQTSPSPRTNNAAERSVMMFLLAKEDRQFAGYELLQTLLASGLRFGEGHLFHRHQQASGQGPVVCSLAAATASGVFDLQNIGAFSVRGLCLFMHVSGHGAVDAERFDIMYQTACQLSEGLDAYLLDEKKQPLNQESLCRYKRTLQISPEEIGELTE